MLNSQGMDATMLVSPTGAVGNNGGFMGGDEGWWIVLLILLLAGGNGFGNNGGFGGGSLYPWMNQSDQINDGFRDQMINSNIAGIQSSVNNLSTQICNGFANVESGAVNRQMANMQQAFAGQTAMNQGFNNLQAQLAQCCCDNRLAVAQTQALIQSENCADRAALSDGIRDLLVNQNNNTQRLLDQMCSDKIDAKNEKIADLERQLTMANLAASQQAQTAAILANNEAQTTALEQYLAPVARPAYIVQNPNCCAQNFGYGCGCGA